MLHFLIMGYTDTEKQCAMNRKKKRVVMCVYLIIHYTKTEEKTHPINKKCNVIYQFVVLCCTRHRTQNAMSPKKRYIALFFAMGYTKTETEPLSVGCIFLCDRRPPGAPSFDTALVNLERPPDHLRTSLFNKQTLGATAFFARSAERTTNGEGRGRSRTARGERSAGERGTGARARAAGRERTASSHSKHFRVRSEKFYLLV